MIVRLYSTSNYRSRAGSKGRGLFKRAWAVFLLCTVTTIGLAAQSLTTLFSGTIFPSVLVQGTDGNLYGTAEYGGTSGFGAVFKITSSGGLTTLYNFCPQYSNCVDGRYPLAGLVQASNGNFYGTTSLNGASTWGTIFKVTPSGTLTTLHSFCVQSGCPDGAAPAATLIQGTNGDLFGTTSAGGSNKACPDFSNGAPGCGTIFKISPSGMLTTLYGFCSQSQCADGNYPVAGLVQASNGDLYGTTKYGGTSIVCGYGCGTAFKITPDGRLTTLHSFCSEGGSNCTDGYSPQTGLIQASNGDLYGTTFGSIFKITPAGVLTTLYSFCYSYGYCSGASDPSGLVQATNGNFYGTTYFGGPDCATYVSGCGTIFEFNRSGVLTTLYTFSCSQSQCADGANPYTELVQDTNGTFYGTTSSTVFSLSVGLGPFVETLPTSGKVGAAVKILGTDLTGATSVTFNGTGAVFNVVSPFLITTTVPASATTGKVEVLRPSGTLSSNAPFRVVR